MTGLLLTGGEGPEKKYISHILEKAPFIVAADSGLDLACRLDLRPDLIIGDMDSLSDRAILDRFPEEKIILFPQDKDETDTELGLRFLNERGCSEIIIAGGGGGRLDHLLALLTLFERPDGPVGWYTSREQVILVRDKVQIDCTPNELISFFPVGGGIATMRSTGLKWELDGLTWARGSVGISNRTTADRVTVEMRSGNLILIRPLDQREYL